MNTLFWLCLAAVLYTYLGPFALALAGSLLRRRSVRRADIEPTVSLVIAAYNEERVIREKIENSLRLDYPRDKLEIVVVADGSSDGTVAAAREYADRGVKVLHEPERRGKTMALNRAAPLTRGEILFFSDANTHYGPETVRKMVRNFHDDTVGGVSGRKIIRPERGRVATRGEKGFWSYETALKTLQTRSGSISTADGEIFCLRRSLFEDIPREVVHDDMYLTLLIVRKGYRVVYEPEATSEEAASKSLVDEFFLKTRYASAGYPLVAAFRKMLLPPRSYFAWQFLTHKLLRWLAPVFLIPLYLASAGRGTPVVSFFFYAQTAFYAAAAAGIVLLLRGWPAGPLYFPAYFCFGNGAAVYGLWKYLGRGQSTLWRKAER